MARLDRLAPVKEVAQIGAAIGREFSHELLAAVSPLPEDAAAATRSTSWSAAELVFRRGTPPEATYSFKHALVQDAAYAALLKSRRQQLHARIAEVLEERFPELREDASPSCSPTTLPRPGSPSRRSTTGSGPGSWRSERSAMTRSGRASRQRAWSCSRPAGDAGARPQELDLLTALGGRSIATGYSAPEDGQAYARARELCERLGETTALVPVLWAVGTYRHDARRARGAARDRAGAAAPREAAARPAPELVGHRIHGYSLSYLGESARAREHLERVLVPLRSRRDTIALPRSTRSTAAAALADLPAALLVARLPEQALAARARRRSPGSRPAHPPSLATR